MYPLEIDAEPRLFVTDARGVYFSGNSVSSTCLGRLLLHRIKESKHCNFLRAFKLKHKISIDTNIADTIAATTTIIAMVVGEIVLSELVELVGVTEVGVRVVEGGVTLVIPVSVFEVIVIVLEDKGMVVLEGSGTGLVGMGVGGGGSSAWK